ncbi:MAG: hypothetical protein Q4A41_01070, partial [Bacillota bacterium]|nr:hypothetical protein [Bacillota bacterium]
MDFYGVILIGGLVLVILAGLGFAGVRYTERTQSRAEELQAKTVNTTRLSKQVAHLMLMSSDDGVKAALKNLKERVDYSSNTSTENSVEHEADFSEALLGIEHAIAGKEEQSAILEKIDAATKIWSARNTYR